MNLPNGQRIVIDSKVSLTAFEAFVNAETDADRTRNLKAHLASMRTHIRALAGKDYQAVTGSGLDYVIIMFVPIEGALAAALQEDPAMTGFAVESNVAIATPTTLMIIALRTVANVWQSAGITMPKPSPSGRGRCTTSSSASSTTWGTWATG